VIKPEQIPYEAKMKLRAVLLDGETDEAVALAAEIARLKAEVTRLRAALGEIHAVSGANNQVAQLARAALSPPAQENNNE
jgi:hypothetical protein